MQSKSQVPEAALARQLNLARGGSREALGELLVKFRRYLLLIANDRASSQLRAKLAASDVVQETFLAAQQSFASFQGTTPRQLAGWLAGILDHKLADRARRFATAKRQLGLELGTERARALSAPRSASPSWQAARSEERVRLDAALTRLPAEYALVIALRNREELEFSEVGRRMSRSPDAARMLWARAISRLQTELGAGSGTTR